MDQWRQNKLPSTLYILQSVILSFNNKIIYSLLQNLKRNVKMLEISFNIFSISTEYAKSSEILHHPEIVS